MFRTSDPCTRTETFPLRASSSMAPHANAPKQVNKLKPPKAPARCFSHREIYTKMLRFLSRVFYDWLIPNELIVSFSPLLKPSLGASHATGKQGETYSRLFSVNQLNLGPEAD